MSYDLKPHGEIGVQLRELFRAELTKTLQAFKTLEAEAEAETAHDARKRLKRLRAILLLLRKPLGKPQYRVENALLRKAGRTLGALRDAQVQVKTLEKVQRRFFSGRAPVVMRAIQEVLLGHQRQCVEQFNALKPGAESVGQLQDMLHRLEDWPVKEYGWKDLRRAVRRSYDRARKAFHHAQEDRGTEALHDWRKRIKELWFHVRLLRRVYPVLMTELAEDFEVLGEFLGDDHDLAVLRLALKALGESIQQTSALETLLELIGVRQEELVEAALDLGARLHDESATEFIARLDLQRSARKQYQHRTKKLVSDLTPA